MKDQNESQDAAHQPTADKAEDPVNKNPLQITGINFLGIFSEEIVLRIFLFLSPFDLLLILHVNKMCWRIAGDNSLWHPLFNIHFSALAPLNIHSTPYYKNLFFQTAKQEYINHIQTGFSFFDTASTHQRFSSNELELFHLTKSNADTLTEFLKKMNASTKNSLNQILNTKDVNGYTAPMWAMALNHQEAVLAFKPYQPVSTLPPSTTALLFATKQAHIQVLDHILTTVPQLTETATTKDGMYVLHEAALHGHVAIFELLTKKHATLVSKMTKKSLLNVTPFFLAVKGEHLKLIEFMLTTPTCVPDMNDLAFTFKHLLTAYENPTPLAVALIKLILQKCQLPPELLAEAITQCDLSLLPLFSKLTDFLQPYTKDNSQLTPLETTIFNGEKARLVEYQHLWPHRPISKIQECYQSALLRRMRVRGNLNYAAEEFYSRMLNPKNEEINLSHLQLSSNLLADIRLFFINLLDGMHLKTLLGIKKIDLSDINLGRKFSHLLNAPSYPGFKSICALIADNPQIEILDLSNTYLDDDAIDEICIALNHNTYLKSIIVNRNETLSTNAMTKLNSLLSSRCSVESPSKKMKLH